MSPSSRNVGNWIVSLGLLLAVALLDYVTGYQVTVILFYLLPILFTLNRLGQGAAILMSVLSAISTLLTDIAAGKDYTDWIVPMWNMGSRIMLFMLVVTLVTARKELEKLVQQRTQKLEEKMQENARLEKELLTVTERERERIGHDLHDSLGQHLTATALAGKILSKKLMVKALPEKEAADQVVRMVENSIEITRQLARSLHPIELAGESFITSLQELAATLSSAFNVSCEFECPQHLALNNRESNIHIYRIMQEAVSNAIRHGHAKKILVLLEPVDNVAHFTITDDGVGLPEAAHLNKGMGLRIMNYRANMIGATFDIARLSQGGTRVSCTLPLTEIFYEDEK